MDDLGAAERVTKTLLEAMTPVINRFEAEEDHEALVTAGPAMVMLGASLLISTIGHEGAAAVLKELTAAAERRDLGGLFPALDKKS